MPRYTFVYWIGIIGVPGKGPNWQENYDPNRTIGQIIQSMKDARLGEGGKRIEMLKHPPGNINGFNKSDPYWDHNTKLSDYHTRMGGGGQDIYLIYCVV